MIDAALRSVAQTYLHEAEVEDAEARMREWIPIVRSGACSSAYFETLAAEHPEAALANVRSKECSETIKGFVSARSWASSRNCLETPIPCPERFLMAPPFWSTRSALRANALELVSADWLYLAPRFPAERTKSIGRSLGRGCALCSLRWEIGLTFQCSGLICSVSQMKSGLLLRL